MKTLSAHFDGKNIVLDEPAELKPNTKVRVLVPEDGETDAEIVGACARLSEPAFEKIWDNPLDAEYDKLYPRRSRAICLCRQDLPQRHVCFVNFFATL